jgi:uncharacterized protein (TIGR03435 family)
VAPLKRNTTGSTSTSMSDRPDGGLVMENGTLRNVIFNAYRPQSTELVGAPAWLADRYNLIAKAAGPATPEQRSAMLRTLLAELLRLQAHYEMREQPVYELVFARRDRSLGSQIVRRQLLLPVGDNYFCRSTVSKERRPPPGAARLLSSAGRWP